MRACSSFVVLFLLSLVLFVAGCATPTDAPASLGVGRQPLTTVTIPGNPGATFDATTPMLGQTLLVPSLESYLQQISFHLDANGMNFQTSVYAWNGTTVGAQLATATQTGVVGVSDYPLTVNAATTPGSQILAVVSCTTCGSGTFYTSTGAYSGGDSWTPGPGGVNDTWTQNVDVDLAMSASFILPTTTTVTNDGPVGRGQSVTVQATVTNGVGGNVVFSENGVTITTVALAADHTASFSTSTLAIGTHTITAAYSGTANAAPSSGTTTVTSNKASTTTTVTSSDNPSTINEAVTLTATVTGQFGGIASGTVTFYDDVASLGAVNLDATGAAKLTTSTLALGGHPNITAVYGGDGNYLGSTSAAFSQSVSQDTVTVAVASSGTPTPYGQAVTLSATVTAKQTYSGQVTGTVSFTDGATNLGTPTLDANGKASVTTSSFVGGTHTITVKYNGDTNHAEKTTTFTQVTSVATPTTTLAALTPKTYGEAIAFVATVSPPSNGLAAPVGNVTFKDGGTTLGVVTLTAGNNGQATFAPSAPLSAGSHSITAVYSPNAIDTNYGGSTSDPVIQVVNQATTTTTLSTQYQPAIAGTSVTLTATLAVNLPGKGTPTGTVQFFDGVAALSGAISLAGGTTVTFPTTFATSADHAITAVYSGDGNFAGSTGSLTQKVVQIGASVSLKSSSNNNESTYGATVTFTVNVTSAQAPVPSGKVVVTDDTTKTTLGTLTLTGTALTLPIATLGGGTHTILASYGGDTTYTPATGSLVQIVDPAPTTTALVSSLNPSTFGQSVTFTATVGSGVSGTRTGTLTFKDGLTTLQTVTLANSVATFTTSALVAGTHAITATYAGDTNYAPSAAGALSQVVDKGNTTTALVSSSSPSLIGSSVIFSATVTAVAPAVGTPTGTVTFRDNGGALNTAPLDKDGIATFSTSALSAGTHPMTATYNGSTDFNASTSGIFAQRVNTEAATISLTATPRPLPPHGLPITFTATLTGKLATPTGSMLFKEGPATLGAGPLQDGVSSFATTVLSAGNHTIVAAYSGDLTYATGSGAVALNVAKQTTTTTVTTSGSPSAIGAPVMLTATIASPAAGFTGQVQFFDAQTSLGFAALTGVTASLNVGSLSAGDHAITAVYGGDENFEGSTSQAVVQNVGILAADAGTDGGAIPPGGGADDGGCGCRAAGSAPLGPLAFGGMLFAGLGLARRRRRRD